MKLLKMTCGCWTWAGVRLNMGVWLACTCVSGSLERGAQRWSKNQIWYTHHTWPCVPMPLRPNAPPIMHLLTPLSPKCQALKVSCEEEWLMWTGPNCPHAPSPWQSLKVWVVPCLQSVLCSSDPETHVQVSLAPVGVFNPSPNEPWKYID